jgi:DNA/RNA endonuclease YhcR with UshA esterase domain
MKAIQKTISVMGIFLLVVLGAPFVFAQTGMGQGMGQGKHMPKYDPSTIATVKGTIQEVQEGMMQSGQMGHMGQMNHMGTHLALKADDKTYTVLVGPSSFVKEKNFTFGKGDQIEVTGSKVNYDGSDALVAREIKKGDKVLTLRDEKGIPEWSRARRP